MDVLNRLLDNFSNIVNSKNALLNEQQNFSDIKNVDFQTLLNSLMEDNNNFIDEQIDLINLPLTDLNNNFSNQATLMGQGAKALEENFFQNIELGKNFWPEKFKEKIALENIAASFANPLDNQLDSSSFFINSSSSAEALKKILDDMGREVSDLTIHPDALPQIKNILLDSGLEPEQVDELMEKFILDSANGKTLKADSLFKILNQTNINNVEQQAFSPEAIPALGQFFLSLGVSPEVAKNILSSYEEGERLSIASLREKVFQSFSQESFIELNLSKLPIDVLNDVLHGFGAKDADFKSLENLLQNSEGDLSLEKFFTFLEKMEQPDNTLNQSQMEAVKYVLRNLEQRDDLVRTPIFNEIILLLGSLGDRELDGDFAKLSPALQALRGGASQVSDNLSNEQQGNFGGDGSKEHGYNDPRQSSSLLNVNSTQVDGSVSQFKETLAGYSLTSQLADKIIYSSKKGLHRLKMKLNPETLGGLEVELKVLKERLTAHISVETHEAFLALEDEIEGLKDSLSSGGLDIANITISLNDNKNNNLSKERKYYQISNADNKQTVKEQEDIKVMKKSSSIYKIA